MLIDFFGFIVVSIFLLKKSLWDVKYIMAYLLVISILFSPLLREVNFGGVRLAGAYALGLVTLYLVVSIYQRPKLGLKRHDLTLGIFVFYCLFTLITSLYYNRFTSALVDYSWFFWFIAVVYLVILNNRDSELYDLVQKIIYISGIILTVGGIFRFLLDQGFVNTTGDVFYIVGSKSVIVGLAFIIAFYNNLRYRRLILFILFIGLVLSLKRQVYLGLLAALFFNYVFFRKEVDFIHVAKIAVVGVVTILALTQLNLASIGPLKGVFGKFGGGNLQNMLTDPAVMYRFASYTTAINGVLESPILGEGWGSSFEFKLVLGGETQYFDHSPHNTFLWMAYKGGLPMLFLYSYLIFYPFYKLYKIRNKILEKRKYKTVFGMLILITFGSLFWDYHSVMFLSVPYWFVWAFAYKTVTQFKTMRVALCPK